MAAKEALNTAQLAAMRVTAQLAAASATTRVGMLMMVRSLQN